MKTTVAFSIGALALGACASSGAGQQATAPEPTAAQTGREPQPGMQHPGMTGEMKGHDMAAECPMAVAGTTARAEDVDGGAAVSFTTTGDVAELRRRVARMAEMHARHHGGRHGPMMGETSKMGDGGKMGMMGEGMKMPPAQARSEDTDGGARLVLTPNAPADLAALREHTRQHAEKMTSGQCPMMSMHGGPDAKPTAPDEHGAHHGSGS